MPAYCKRPSPSQTSSYSEHAAERAAQTAYSKKQTRLPPSRVRGRSSSRSPAPPVRATSAAASTSAAR